MDREREARHRDIAVGRRQRFLAQDGGEEWKGLRDLAQLCDAAGLFVCQARIVLLICRGCSGAEAGIILGMSRQAVWKGFRRAVKVIGRKQPTAETRFRAGKRMVLECVKNKPLRGGDEAEDDLLPEFSVDSCALRPLHPELVTVDDLAGPSLGYLASMLEAARRTSERAVTQGVDG